MKDFKDIFFFFLNLEKLKDKFFGGCVGIIGAFKFPA